MHVNFRLENDTLQSKNFIRPSIFLRVPSMMPKSLNGKLDRTIWSH